MSFSNSTTGKTLRKDKFYPSLKNCYNYYIFKRAACLNKPLPENFHDSTVPVFMNMSKFGNFSTKVRNPNLCLYGAVEFIVKCNIETNKNPFLRISK